MNRFKTIFLRGLLTLLPMAVTIYILYAGILIFENFLGGVIKFVLPERDYIPGLGFALTIVLIFVFGLLLNNLIVETLLRKLEESLKEIPLVKAVYSPVRDLMNLFSGSGKRGLQGVVLVPWSESGPLSIGLVTRDKFDDIPKLQDQDLIAVFIPLSYGVGGVTMLFRRSQVRPLDIPIEKALQLAITGWVKIDPAQDGKLPK
ncbi:MAG: DUF502 domain-containing protein [Bdellovibrionales bacterium]